MQERIKEIGGGQNKRKKEEKNTAAEQEKEEEGKRDMRAEFSTTLRMSKDVVTTEQQQNDRYASRCT